MTRIYIFLFSTITFIFLASSCHQKAVENNNLSANQNTMNQNMMNQNGTNMMNGNQMTIQHDGMKLEDTKSMPDASKAPFDLQFIDTMIAHHDGAIVMAKMAVEKAQHQELKNLANNIINSQAKEITQMREWREKWYAEQPLALNMGLPGMMDSMRNMSMKNLAVTSGNDFDLMFIKMMIPHHEGAIAMAKDALDKAEHPEIKTLAKGVIMDQEAEINSMKNWMTEWSKGSF